MFEGAPFYAIAVWWFAVGTLIVAAAVTSFKWTHRHRSTLDHGRAQVVHAMGATLHGLGIVVWVVFGLWGFFLDLAIVERAAGFWGVVVGVALGPVTYAAAPWYALVRWGVWFPLVISYGGGIAGSGLYAIGSRVSSRE